MLTEIGETETDQDPIDRVVVDTYQIPDENRDVNHDKSIFPSENIRVRRSQGQN